MNKKRETIRKPVNHESIPDWDDQDRIVPTKQTKNRKHHLEEEDMIREKNDY